MSATVNHSSVVSSRFLMLTAIVCGVLGSLRVFYNISVTQPFQIFTSGLEEEALFSIWKFIHGQPVYSDPFSIPFSGSYFNWLFYIVYGWLTSVVLQALRLSSDWIPTITHLISFGFALLCVPVTAWLIKLLRVREAVQSRSLDWAAGVVVAFNPLVGWWNMTARPDMAALFLELLALYLGLQFVRRNHRGFLVGCVMVAYLAWSCRQTAVNVVSGLCVYLLLCRRWKDLSLVVTLSFVLYALTFVIGGNDYWINTVICNGAADLLVSHGVDNWFQAVLKSPLLLGGFAALIVCFACSRFRTASPEVNLVAATCAFAIVWGWFTGMKVGASQNYYMVPTALSLLLAMVVFGFDAFRVVGQRLGTVLWAVLLLAQAASCFVVLVGGGGRIDIRTDQVPALILKQKLSGVEGPIFVTDRSLNLPWINPAVPHFVFAYVYRVGPLKDRHYEQGGVEGLIEQRRFRMVIRPKHSGYSDWPDLTGRYVVQDEDEWFTYYIPAHRVSGAKGG